MSGLVASGCTSKVYSFRVWNAAELFSVSKGRTTISRSATIYLPPFFFLGAAFLAAGFLAALAFGAFFSALGLAAFFAAFASAFLAFGATFFALGATLPWATGA